MNESPAAGSRNQSPERAPGSEAQGSGAEEPLVLPVERSGYNLAARVYGERARPVAVPPQTANGASDAVVVSNPPPNNTASSPPVPTHSSRLPVRS